MMHDYGRHLPCGCHALRIEDTDRWDVTLCDVHGGTGASPFVRDLLTEPVGR